MKTAIKYIQNATKNFLEENISKIVDYRESNELLFNLTGIDNFFRNEEDFLTLLELLKPSHTVREKTYRREYGDFQTPSKLTDNICLYLNKEGISPDIIIEPTFGKGSFLISAIKYFPKLLRIYGIEIYEPYYWETKFTMLEFFLENKNFNRPLISLYLTDVFNFDFVEIETLSKDSDILVIGNPPWVTSSELSALNSENLPRKTNIKFLNGIDAITGKSNFDISEYIMLMMFEHFSKYKGHLAMLVKNSVIKNLLQFLPSSDYKISNMLALKINAKQCFNASVEASLFKCSFIPNKLSTTCKVSSLLSPSTIESEFGWVGNKFVSNEVLYEQNKKYDGVSPFTWRQGIKHDCSKVMELQLLHTGKFLNGFKKEIDVETDLIFSLAKSSDLNTSVVSKLRKHIIITQKRVGEDTTYLSYKFPKLYKYLKAYEHLFMKRKSSIYKNKYQFSIFGIGDYSFRLYKVAISGLYKRSRFSLIQPVNKKPVMLDDTCYFLGFDNLPEAIFVWAILNSKSVQQLLASITFLDAKRPYTKDVLMRISIDKVAEAVTFEEIINQIKLLDEKMLINVNKEKWNVFLSMIEKTDLQTKMSFSRYADKAYDYKS